MNCYFCDTPIVPGDELAPGTLLVDGKHAPTHRECSLRSVMGGIGHLENHSYWCLTMKDPDGGLTYRESALRVDDWIASRASRPYEEED
jgi:hypothetical protein